MLTSCTSQAVFSLNSGVGVCRRIHCLCRFVQALVSGRVQCCGRASEPREEVGWKRPGRRTRLNVLIRWIRAMRSFCSL